MGLFSALFGGGGSSSSTVTSSNTTNVTVTPQVGVAVPVSIDTSSLAQALSALAGADQSGQTAIAGAVAANATALQAQGKAISDALASVGGGLSSTQISVAALGLIGVLIAARWIKKPHLKLKV